jgi:protoporphyrinogen oxidase
MRTPAPVGVVGAGIAGLVAARDLARRGIPVVVFEAGKAVAGMAVTHKDPDGFSYDTGAHFITNRLAREIGVLGQCRLVRNYGEAVVVGKKSYGYPFGLLRTPKFVRSAIKAKLSHEGGGHATGNAADWFRRAYGTALADEVALPLVEAWSGLPADQLSSAVGDKIPGGLLATVGLKAAAKVSRRAIAIGYCREQPQSVRVWHVYPEHGVVTLCNHLADELGASVRLESPVERVLVEDGAVRALRAAGEEIEVSAVISTAPVNILPKIVEGTDQLERFRPFRYRPMIFVNMRMEGRGLLPDVVTWTPESQYPFFRLTETTLSMPWHAPDGKTLVMADIGAEIGDDNWTMDDAVLGKKCLEALTAIVPDAPTRYLGCRVVRTPIAYPVFSNEYERDRQGLEQSTGVDGLLSIGRNGEFAHILMEDVYWRTRRRVERLVAERADIAEA